MSTRKLINKLIAFIKKREVVSLECIEQEFDSTGQDKVNRLLRDCCLSGYIENIQIHAGYHQIGTIDSNQYRVTTNGELYLDKYARERNAKYRDVGFKILLGVVVPVVLFYLSKCM